MAGGGPGGYAQPEAEGGEIDVSIEEAYAGTRRRVTTRENGRARARSMSRSRPGSRTVRRCASAGRLAGAP